MENEVKVLKHLYNSSTRNRNGWKCDFEENIMKIFNLTKNDVRDLYGGNLIYIEHDFQGRTVVSITNEGNRFVKKYHYNRLKEYSYWIFGCASLIAAIFSTISVLC